MHMHTGQEKRADVARVLGVPCMRALCPSGLGTELGQLYHRVSYGKRQPVWPVQMGLRCGRQ